MGALDNQQYGINSADGAQGDKGIAMKNNEKFDGSPDQDQHFEGMAANTNCSAAQAQSSGRQ